MDGVLVIDKPAGITSHDVVDDVRSRLGTKKVGHGGTLDPDATGVLVIGVGRATRLLAYSQRAPKRYTAVAVFGATTSTQDASGQIVSRRGADIDREDVERTIKEFTGAIEQVPPMVSAVKVRGERLYRKARRGEEVERRARPVTVYDLDVTGFDGDGPRATLDVQCSAGTFVRTLIHDIGARIGCGAYLESLRRTEAGWFRLADAIALEEVSRDRLRPLRDAVRGLPVMSADDEETSLVRHGRPLPVRGEVEEGAHVAVCAGERLLAVYRRRREWLLPDRVVGA